MTTVEKILEETLESTEEENNIANTLWQQMRVERRGDGDGESLLLLEAMTTETDIRRSECMPSIHIFYCAMFNTYLLHHCSRPVGSSKVCHFINASFIAWACLCRYVASVTAQIRSS